MEKRVERNREIEKKLIKKVAEKTMDFEFIHYVLNHMDSVKKKQELLEWLEINPKSTTKDIEWKMFNITTGIEK